MIKQIRLNRDHIYIGEVNNDIPHGFGVYINTDINEPVYIGGIKNNTFDGLGKEILNDGNRLLIGLFEDEIHRGFTRRIDFNKYTYLYGELDNDYFDGEVFSYTKGYLPKYYYYEEDQRIDQKLFAPYPKELLKNIPYVLYDKEITFDEIIYDNGSYIGGLLRGKRHYFGRYTWKDNNEIYIGEWKDDLLHGFGEYFFNNGDIYIGEWNEDKRTGFGKYLFKSGAIYLGTFQDGIIEGYGSYLWSNGDFYFGNWKDGKRDGYGVYIYADNDLKAGKFKENEFVGETE